MTDRKNQNHDTYRALTADEVCDILEGAERLLLVRHSRPDGDAVGSTVGLALALTRMGKTVSLLCADPTPDRLSFLDELFSPAPLDPAQPCTVVTVDVASPFQLGSIGSQLTGGLAPTLSIDHHANRTPFADFYVRPEASSAGEIVYTLLRRLMERGQLDGITPPIADALFASVSSDTGCFRFGNALPATHRAAAELIEYGARSALLNRLLFDTKSLGVLRAEGYAASHIRLYSGGRIAFFVLTRALREELGLTEADFEGAIDTIRSLAGVEIAVTVKENDRGTWKASLRSIEPDVAVVAASFGGGGHILASGCALPAHDAAEAEQIVLDRIHDFHPRYRMR